MAANNRGHTMEIDNASQALRPGAKPSEASPAPLYLLLALAFLAAVVFTGIAFYRVHQVLGVIMAACLVSQLAAVVLARGVLSKGQGDQAMVNVGDYIREGSEAFVKKMFGTILKFLLLLSACIFVIEILQDSIESSLMITLSFVFGALCSGASGIIGMWSSTRANARVAYTACSENFQNTIVVALRSGAVAGLTVVSLALMGVSILFTIAMLIEENPGKVPLLIVGYGFGASFVALFCQLGGGIFTKAADVGADLTGKLEAGIPEDDPRNPAVIADLVGDNVGDCCARGADLFESLSAEIIAAMILGATLIERSGLDATQQRDTQMMYMFFPLAVHVFDLIVSVIGVLCVRPNDSPQGQGAMENPMTVLKRGYIVAVTLGAVALVGTTKGFLDIATLPEVWWHFLLCGIVGILAGFAIVYITQYYTDFSHGPVQDIAKASEFGHATNIIAGLAIGMESTFPIMIAVCTAILSSYYLGYTSGFEGGDSKDAAGLYGTAVATMGMLSNLTYVLAMDVFGPITDNAAGIVEMSEQPAAARDIMDRLDAAGNTTKAMTKGFAVGSAGLACFLLFRAFIDVVYEETHVMITADIARPQVFIAGIMGAATVFLFSAMAMKAVGTTAQLVVEEVRRQFQDPRVRTGETKPDYGTCVDIVTTASIRQMVVPGVLVIGMPCLMGLIFRLVGAIVGDDLLGAHAMLGFLVCSSMTAMLMALFLNNSGGAWDNAKKYIEMGNHGGKGSDPHRAAITGDTVGDPSKDTAGPSLHVLMKLVATITMVMGPILAIPSTGK